MLDAVSAHASLALKLAKASSPLDASARIQTLLDTFSLSVKNVGPNSALLFGADACIDPTSQTIRIRRDVSPLYRREVLAHELAHAILGHDSSGTFVKSRDYVSAYGTNERIERMADNLAAILLVSDDDLERARIACPNFSSAAEYLEVTPDTLIRRLTQYRSPVTEYPADRPKLLPFQVEAVEWTGNICLDAGVGTGKTEVLLERLLRIAEDSSSGHSRILFVTYLRRHMVYLFERMALVAPMLAERVNFTTFHDYAADIVLRNAAVTGCLGTPTVIGEGEIKTLLVKAFPDASSDELKRMCNDFRQGFRHETSQSEPWAVALSEQLYALNYIHNGSLGELASRLMQSDTIASDEADRWDGVFVDNYEQLTYAELTVLRLASQRAQYGISVASGLSALPYAFRGLSDSATTQWKQECALKCFDFGSQSRIRPQPNVATLNADNAVVATVNAVRDQVGQLQDDDKIVIAVRHNTTIAKLQDALAVEFPDSFGQDTELLKMSQLLYALIDSGTTTDEFLDAWWASYSTCSDEEAKHLQTVLANCQMYTKHCERSAAVGFPNVSMETYMESIRPHHQYRDIQLSEPLGIQTLHSLSGGEAAHVIVLTDGLDMLNLSPADRALFDNACARATKTLTLVGGESDVTRVR